MVDPVAGRRSTDAPENEWKAFKPSQGIKGVQEYPLDAEKEEEVEKKYENKNKASRKINLDFMKKIELDEENGGKSKKALAQADPAPAGDAKPAGGPAEKVFHLEPEFYNEHANTYWETPRTTFIAQ
jgi:hypothetical protein